MTLFLILLIIGAVFIVLGYGNQLKLGHKEENDKTTTTTTIKYVPMEYYEDMILTHKE
tara:strand:- start:302 stop:475 length:174 start_codon:yes stop_codon:yes gene_type:complete